MGGGVLTRPAGRGNYFVYGTRKGRVSFVALAAPRVASKRATLQKYLRLAGLR
jgi:hypothetical protein